MRILVLAAFLALSCTPANVSDNRVMSDGKPNAVVTEADANPSPSQSPGTNTGKPTAGDPNPALASFLPVAYTEDLEPLLQNYCTTACHTGAPAPGPMALNTADTLKASLAAATTAVSGGTMPPNLAELNALDKKRLAQLAISLKNWSRNDAYALNLADFKITYTPAVTAVSTALCVNCHAGDQPSGGLRLETQDQWKTAMPQILRAIGSRSMPPRIDEVQAPRLVKFLSTWQNQGFP
ncbi:MAG TPA: hypothetical protein VFO10_09700 [Oligoflexus sp.]|uniref:hypothetical protein n=1 Tax=Oligoflexus sp. TaxID=1971216 RepID=UPI002D7F769E|nr:hypothetical protein [Oligoflexus sp.]HET9237513.1 hypothetical protein [Oligoflexus sp.]